MPKGCRSCLRSVIPSTRLPNKAKKVRLQSYTLKVTYTSLKEGKIKNPTRQLYILINDETANVEYIKKQCQEELEKDGIVLATANGLLIEDSAATRGLTFWKATARKIFAVEKKSKKELKIVVLVEDEKAIKDSGMNEELFTKILSALETQTADMKAFVSRTMSDTSISRQVRDLVNCVICHETSRPEMKFGGCCGSILGCTQCLDEWYRDNVNCPKCRGSFRKSMLYTIRRVDDILSKLKADNDLQHGI